MDTWIKFGWILLTAINTWGLNLAQTRETHCNNYELMSCGGLEKSWDLCEPRTANVRRIVSAHLDIRYDTRNCRKYGTPHNFGLTFNGRSLWTVNACFGSFLLCLDKDGTSGNNNTSEGDNHSSEINDIQGEYFHTNEYTLDDTDADGDTGVIDDQTTSTDTAADDTGNVMYDNDTVTLSRVHNQSDDGSKTAEKIEFIQHEESSMSSIKYWIMGCIIGGGVIIVGLIAVMAYLCSCTDSQGDEEDQKTRRSNNTSTNYFRQKKWSIAPLMSESGRTTSVTSSTCPSSPTIETNDYKDVYDFIPADIKSNNNNTKVRNDMEVKPTLHIVEETGNTECTPKHDYFVLIPEPVSGSDTRTVKSDGTEVENEYDHLVHNPKHTVVDASAYNHIDIKTGTIDGNVV